MIKTHFILIWPTLQVLHGLARTFCLFLRFRERNTQTYHRCSKTTFTDKMYISIAYIYILIKNHWSSIYWCLEPCYNVVSVWDFNRWKGYGYLSINSEVSIEKQRGQCSGIGDGQDNLRVWIDSKTSCWHSVWPLIRNRTYPLPPYCDLIDFVTGVSFFMLHERKLFRWQSREYKCSLNAAWKDKKRMIIKRLL